MHEIVAEGVSPRQAQTAGLAVGVGQHHSVARLHCRYATADLLNWVAPCKLDVMAA